LVKRILIVFLILFFNLNSAYLFAQKSKNYNIGANFQYGSLVKHSKQMSHFTYNNSTGGAFFIGRKTNGDKLWHRLAHYPEIGVSLNYTSYGNPSLLGTAFSIMPYINFMIVKNNFVSFNFRVGAGLGYLTKTYDIVDNPENNAIGSAINNATSFQFTLDWKLSKKIILQSGFIHKHFSNAVFKSPNLGLNVPSAMLGLKYVMHSVTINKKDSIPSLSKNFIFTFRSAFALKEDAKPGGPKYPVYMAALSVGRRLSHINRIYLGFYMAYYSPAYEFMIMQEIYEEDNQRIKATRIGIEIEDEFIFGRIAISGQFGYYLHNKFLKFSNVYNRLGVLYYYMNKHMFSGIYLKSHKSVADYLEFTVGCRL